MKRQHACLSLLALSVGLFAAGCAAGSSSRVSTGVPPSPVASGALPSTNITTGTAISGTGTVGPGATVTAVPGGSTPSTTPGPPPPTTAPPPTSPPPAPAGPGAYGYITAGPTCPVERPGQACPPRPLAVTLHAQDASGRQVATTSSDSSGRYLLALAPGVYTLTASTGSVLPRCPPTEVTITASAPARADISCDTGIR